MKKRLLAAVVAVLMVVSFFPISGYAAEQHDVGNGDVSISAHSSGSCPGHVITGTSDTVIAWNQHNISISGGTHTITLKDVNIATPGIGKSAIDIQDGANVTIVLEGSNSLYGATSHPAIWVEEGSSLTIELKDNSNLYGGASSPAILVEENSSLIVEGTGSLTAEAGTSTPGTGAAAIGSGYGTNTSLGNIIINGGTIVARGSGGGAGIGGGYETGSGTCSGNITINGGYVKAFGGQSGLGVTGGAGIGSGENANYGGTITINGGVVYAEGGADSMSIGAGGRGIGESGNGTFSTGTNGNAVIVAPDGIGDPSDNINWDGIFISYEGNENSATVSGNTVTLNDSAANIQVWGEPVIDYNLTVASGTTLKITDNDRNNKGATLGVATGSTLTNNGTIELYGNAGNSSFLILNEGRSQTAGNGTLTVGQYGAVKLPLSQEMVIINGTDGLSYTGEAKEPIETVKLENLWGYTQGFTRNEDYTVSYLNNVNAGTATVSVTSTGTGHLLGTDTVNINFNIAKADFFINLPAEWSVKEGEDNLIAKLPKPVSITADSSIKDNLAGVKAGTLTWYMDKSMTQPVTDTYLQDKVAGENVTLYWSYSHNDGNFVSPKTGQMTAKITKLTPPDVVVEIGGVTSDDYLINKVYGDESEKVDIKISFDDGATTEEPKSPVTFTSSDESVATVDNQGNITFTGAGHAVITVNIAEYDDPSGDLSKSYAAVNARIDVNVSPKPIEVDITKTTIEPREYDGTLNVNVSAQLKDGSIVSGDEGKVILKAEGLLEDATAGKDKKVNIKYSLEGERAYNYILTPETGEGVVDIADNSSPGGDGTDEDNPSTPGTTDEDGNTGGDKDNATSSDEEKSDSVKTGDDTAIALMIALLIASGAGLVAIRRKH